MRTSIMTVCAVFAATMAFAAAPGVVTDKSGEEHKGQISWSTRDKAYVVSIKGVEMQVKQSNVDKIDIVKPKEFDAAKEKVEKGASVSTAIPVLQKIVKDYAHLQWDKPAGRYLIKAYLDTGKKDEALKLCQDVVRADETAAYKGEFAPAYWDTLLEHNKAETLERCLAKAVKTGDRFSSASALIMRGKMLYKSGEGSSTAARAALTAGFLRVVLLYTEEGVAEKVRPEALYRAAQCFDAMKMAGRADVMRSELRKLYPNYIPPKN